MLLLTNSEVKNSPEYVFNFSVIAYISEVAFLLFILKNTDHSKCRLLTPNSCLIESYLLNNVGVFTHKSIVARNMMCTGKYVFTTFSDH